MKELVGYYLKYLEGDFSLTVVDDKKASICKWTELQTKKLNKDEFTNILKIILRQLLRLKGKKGMLSCTRTVVLTVLSIRIFNISMIRIGIH
jgi:hypothetical protein